MKRDAGAAAYKAGDIPANPGPMRRSRRFPRLGAGGTWVTVVSDWHPDPAAGPVAAGEVMMPGGVAIKR